jgi:phosphate transport system permease protein
MAIATDAINPLGPSGNLPRRRRVDQLMRGSATAAALLAVGVLLVVIISIVQRGASSLSAGFFTQAPPAFGATVGGGIAPEIVGTLLIVAIATAMALPLGILIAIFLTEYATPRTAYPVRLGLDLLNGLPSIVVGVFVFGLLVSGGSQFGFAGSVALGIIMLPLIARATQEVLLLVPQAQRDAAHALGMSRWRTTLGIVLPACVSGILTGTVLAVARAAGETAPLIALSSFFAPNAGTTVNVFGVAMPNIPIEIFTGSESSFPADHARAWGAALVLMAFILIANLSARGLLARSRRRKYR